MLIIWCQIAFMDLTSSGLTHSDTVNGSKYLYSWFAIGQQTHRGRRRGKKNMYCMQYQFHEGSERREKVLSVLTTHLIWATKYKRCHPCSLHLSLSAPRCASPTSYELLSKIQKCEIIGHLVNIHHEKQVITSYW